MLRTVASNRLRRATRHILGVDPGGRLAIGESSAGRGRSASEPAERFSRATAPAASAGVRVLRGRRLASEQDSRPCRNRWLADFVGLACCDAAAGASHSSRAAHDGSRRRVRAAVFVRAARLEVSAIPKQPDVGPAISWAWTPEGGWRLASRQRGEGDRLASRLSDSLARRRLLRRRAYEFCEGGASRRSRTPAPVATDGWPTSSALPVATRRRGPRIRVEQPTMAHAAGCGPPSSSGPPVSR